MKLAGEGEQEAKDLNRCSPDLLTSCFELLAPLSPVAISLPPATVEDTRPAAAAPGYAFLVLTAEQERRRRSTGDNGIRRKELKSFVLLISLPPVNLLTSLSPVPIS